MSGLIDQFNELFKGLMMESQIKTYEQFCDFWGFDKKSEDFSDIHSSYVAELEKPDFALPFEDDYF